MVCPSARMIDGQAVLCHLGELRRLEGIVRPWLDLADGRPGNGNLKRLRTWIPRTIWDPFGWIAVRHPRRRRVEVFYPQLIDSGRTTLHAKTHVLFGVVILILPVEADRQGTASMYDKNMVLYQASHKPEDLTLSV